MAKGGASVGVGARRLTEGAIGRAEAEQGGGQTGGRGRLEHAHVELAELARLEAHLVGVLVVVCARACRLLDRRRGDDEHIAGLGELDTVGGEGRLERTEPERAPSVHKTLGKNGSSTARRLIATAAALQRQLDVVDVIAAATGQLDVADDEDAELGAEREPVVVVVVVCAIAALHAHLFGLRVALLEEQSARRHAHLHKAIGPQPRLTAQ